jgi:hypothetical protein
LFQFPVGIVESRDYRYIVLILLLVLCFSSP